MKTNNYLKDALICGLIVFFTIIINNIICDYVFKSRNFILSFVLYVIIYLILYFIIVELPKKIKRKNK